MSTRLNNSVIVRQWSENKGHHHIKDPSTLSKVMCGEVKKITHTMAFSQNYEANSSQEMEQKRGGLG